MSRQHFTSEADHILADRIEDLRRLTFEQASALPEVKGTYRTVGGYRAGITTYRQIGPYQLDGLVLVTVLVSRPRLFGISAHHIERGLVFSPNDLVREATVRELENSGG